MKFNTVNLLMFLSSASLLLSSCDLLHTKERINCFRATGDVAKCRADKNCNSFGGGPECKNCNNAFCTPVTTAQSCVMTSKTCGNPGNMHVRNGVADDFSKKKWLKKSLDEKLYILSKMTITPTILSSLDLKQRRTLCGAWTLPCTLSWNASKKIAECQTDANTCDTCKYTVTEHKCQVRNLCNGVICF